MKEFVEESLRKAILAKAVEIGEEEAALAAERTRKRVRELVPQIACACNRQFDYQLGSDRVTLVIRMDERAKG